MALGQVGHQVLHSSPDTKYHSTHAPHPCCTHLTATLSHSAIEILRKFKYFAKNAIIFKFDFFIDVIIFDVGRVAQAVQRLATGWTIRGSNPGGGKFFHTCPDRPWGPPSLLYNGFRVFLGGKERPGRDADPSPPSSAVVMKG